MKAFVIVSLVLAVATVSLSICNSYKKMGKHIDDISLTCTPEVLTLNNGTIGTEVSVTFPEKYFDSKTIAKVTPVIVYEGGEVVGTPYYYQGSKVDDNYEVVEKDGGVFTENIEFDYTDEMIKSELQLRVEFKKSTSKKDFVLLNINTGKVVSKDETEVLAENSSDADAIRRSCGYTVAYGVNVMQDDFKYSDLMETMDNNYKLVINTVTKADLAYKINSSKVDSKNLSTSQIDAFKELVATNKTNDRATQSLYANGYASPDGPETFNDKLSKARSESAKKAMDELLEEYGLNVDAAAYGEDWDGFKELVSASDIEDKGLILQVLSLYDSSTQREAEIKNLASVFAELKDDILPALRRAQMLNSTDTQGKTDSEMMVLVNQKNYSELTLEELLHLADSVIEDNETKAEVLSYAAKTYGDARAYNNLGVVLSDMGMNEASLEAFEQASRKGAEATTINKNLALSNLDNGNVAEAGKYSADAETKSALAVAQGNYSAAAATLTGYNAAIANVMNNNYNAAKSAISGDNSADADYLRAVIAALQGDVKTAGAQLKAAIAKNALLAKKAATDVNLANLFESGFEL